MVTGHSFYTTLTLNQVTPLIFCSVSVLFTIVVKNSPLARLFEATGFLQKYKSPNVVQNLPNFYSALSSYDRKWLIEEQRYYRELYGLKIHNDKL